MNNLANEIKLSGFEDVLRACNESGFQIISAIDGGAGWGGTSQSIADEIDSNGIVYAFEPFPGNHSFFNNYAAQIVLIKKALSNKNKNLKLHIPSTISESSKWANGERTGYSSVGYLSEGLVATLKRFIKSIVKKGEYINVQAVCADDEIGAFKKIDFIKLDLQGGELNALKGMKKILKNSKILWVEFTGDMRVYEYLINNGYSLFDAEYLFNGKLCKNSKKYFEFSKFSELSTGEKVWWGHRKKPYENIAKEFKYYQKELGMIQTDLLCINNKFIHEFNKVLPVLYKLIAANKIT
jgi:FkbM family methyltransferase